MSLSLTSLDYAKKRDEYVGPTDRPVLVVGAAGQLGQTMVECLGESWPVVSLTRDDLDLTNVNRVRQRVQELTPSVIVNCAAYNLVDLAEDQPETAMEINAFCVRALGRAANDVNATLVHYSTDFVFDGRTDRPYTEDDRPAPQSVYAASKLLGEWFAAEVPAHYILRVESLFGGRARRKSSLDTIVNSIAAGRSTKVFVDRVVSPSYVWDVSNATAELLRRRPASGLYHCVNTGAITWHDLAVEIRRQLESNATLEPVAMADVPLTAARPRYSALSNQKLREAGIPMPTWQDALTRYLREREAHAHEGSARAESQPPTAVDSRRSERSL
jgi:dTDP-4-dehydrorhamnose reductase